MTSLTKRLVGKGTGYNMEYEEEPVHNVLAVTCNAIVSIASKVGDDVLQIMTILVIAPQPAKLSNPAANPPCTLLKVPNILVIKQVHMPSSKLKATKLWPQLAEPLP